MEWTTIVLALITLVSAALTGNGSISDEQAAILNESTPGLGTTLQAAVTASNGAVPAYTEWAAQSSILSGLGLGSPFSVSGLAENVSSFLGSVNIWVLLAIAAAVYYVFFRKDSSYG